MDSCLPMIPMRRVNATRASGGESDEQLGTIGCELLAADAGASIKVDEMEICFDHRELDNQMKEELVILMSLICCRFHYIVCSDSSVARVWLRGLRLVIRAGSW